MVRMKTTLELPDDLLRRVKVLAAQSDRKLEDTLAQLLEAGLKVAPAPAPLAPPRPKRLRRRGPQTMADIEAAIAGGRD